MSQFLEDHWAWLLSLGGGLIVLCFAISKWGIGVLWDPLTAWLGKRDISAKREKRRRVGDS
jgi:hypothetical protein